MLLEYPYEKDEGYRREPIEMELVTRREKQEHERKNVDDNSNNWISERRCGRMTESIKVAHRYLTSSEHKHYRCHMLFGYLYEVAKDEEYRGEASRWNLRGDERSMSTRVKTSMTTPTFQDHSADTGE